MPAARLASRSAYLTPAAALHTRARASVRARASPTTPPAPRGPSMGGRLSGLFAGLVREMEGEMGVVCGACEAARAHSPPPPPQFPASRASMATAACARAPDTPPPGLKMATFAGGCFWGLELAFQRVAGVTATSVGYTDGPDPAPTYESVCSGRTGHAEAVQVYYDPAETSYEALLDVFFDKVDPTTANRQGGDVGTQYRSALYYHDDDQKRAIEAAVEAVDAKLASNVFRRVLGTRVVSDVRPAQPYFLAEAYHQQYLARGGRFGAPQSTAKGCKDTIRCYG